MFVTNPNSQAQAAEALAEIDAGSLSGSAKDLYDHLMEAISDYVYSDAVGAGDTAYMSGDYRAAIEHYEKAVEAKPDDAHALQYLGISYYQIKDTTNADRVLNEFIQKFPARAAEVQAYISGNGGGTRQGNAGNSGGTGESGAPVKIPREVLKVTVRMKTQAIQMRRGMAALPAITHPGEVQTGRAAGFPGRTVWDLHSREKPLIRGRVQITAHVPSLYH